MLPEIGKPKVSSKIESDEEAD
jgi:hypothetical protein